MMLSFLRIYCLFAAVGVARVDSEFKLSGFLIEEPDCITNCSTEKPSICYTKGCIDASNKIRKNLNERADPCLNFEEFACGGFRRRFSHLKRNIIFVNQAFSMLETKLLRLKYKLLRRPFDPTTELPTIAKLKGYFGQCINSSDREMKGTLPLKQILSKLGGWPILEKEGFRNETRTWYSILLSFKDLGFGVGSSFIVNFRDSGGDARNKKVIILSKPLMPRVLLLPRTYENKYLTPDTNVEQYKGIPPKKKRRTYSSAILKILKLLTNVTQRMEDEAIKMEELAHSLQSIYKHTEKDIVSLRNLKSLPFHPKSWSSFLNDLLGETFDNSTIVVLEDSQYLTRLSELFSRTNPQTIANFMIGNFVLSALQFLNHKARTLSRKLLKTLNDHTGSIPLQKWSECVKRSERLKIPLSRLFIQNYFEDEYRLRVQNLAKLILAEKAIKISKSSWMTPNVKIMALDKLKYMKILIGHTEKLFNDATLEEDHKDINIFSDFLTSSLGLEVHYQKKEKLLKSPQDYLDDTTTVGAEYYSDKNILALKAGILYGGSKDHFFSPDRPEYLNFGALGSIIGHEISHCFDKIGQKFDAKGAYNNWWDEATASHYANTTDCLVRKYEKLGDIDWYKRSEENIADSSGFQVAYNAYDKWTEINGHEPLLPNLPYNPRQLFWISFAQNYCSKFSNEGWEVFLRQDIHAPAPFRIMGVSLNSPNFVEDFDCNATFFDREYCEFFA